MSDYFPTLLYYTCVDHLVLVSHIKQPLYSASISRSKPFWTCFRTGELRPKLTKTHTHTHKFEVPECLNRPCSYLAVSHQFSHPYNAHQSQLKGYPQDKGTLTKSSWKRLEISIEKNTGIVQVHHVVENRWKYDGHLSIQGYQRPPSAAPTSTSSTSSLPPSGAFELAFGGTWGRPPRCRDVANVQHWQKTLCYAGNKTIHLDCQVTSGWLYIYIYTYTYTYHSNMYYMPMMCMHIMKWYWI